MTVSIALGRVAGIGGDAEIRQLQLPLFIEQKISRLKIAMYYTLGMCVRQRGAQLAKNRAEKFPRQHPARLALAHDAEVHALHVFHRDKRGFAGERVEIVNADDVRMTEPPAPARLEAQVLEGFGH